MTPETVVTTDIDTHTVTSYSWGEGCYVRYWIIAPDEEVETETEAAGDSSPAAF